MANEHRKSVSLKKGKRELILVQLWESVKSVLRCIVSCLLFVWNHNPGKVIAQRQKRLYFVENYDGIMIKPKLKERMVDLFLTDYRRKKRLLRWVHKRLRSPEVHDFTTCWQDGTVLCALLESICPGVCPGYYLLNHLNMVKNCRLGIKLANKYLYVPMDLLTAEEMAIAKQESESKIIQYISMIKWASQNIKEKWSSLHESLIAAKTGRCFAKGSGLRNGIVGKRSKFTIVVSDTIGVFNLIVEVRGPNNECYGEQIVSLHQAKGVLDENPDTSSKDAIRYMEDGVGNTFVRQKIPSRNSSESANDPMTLGLQCGEEGTFYVTYVPRRVGIHAVTVKWQNNHVENSPFRIKVYKASNVSTKSLKGAKERRLIYDSLSVTTLPGQSDENYETVDTKGQIVAIPDYEHATRLDSAIAKSKAYSKGRQLTVTSRRVLRRIITRNGEDIVIEEAISPSLSRQSSITDNSDDDIVRNHRREKDDKRHSPLHAGATFSYVQSNTESGKQGSSLPLGTVLEERQNSNDNLFKNLDLSEVLRSSSFQQTLEEFTMETGMPKMDGMKRENKHKQSDVTSLDVSKMTPSRDPQVRYTCTELNEHNILELNASNDEGERMTERSGNYVDDGSANSFWFKQPSDVDVNIANRSPLERSTSMHGVASNKVVARRSTSDSSMYELRRNIVSITASDMSESSSEISTDDKRSPYDDERGVPNHALKLLQSNSLKKACLYVSDKAFPKVYPEDEILNNDMAEFSFPVQTSRYSPSFEMNKHDVPNYSEAPNIKERAPCEQSSKKPQTTPGSVSRFDWISKTDSSSAQSQNTSTALWKGLDEGFVNVYVTDGIETHTSDSNTALCALETGRNVDSGQHHLTEAGKQLDHEGKHEPRVVSRYEQTITSVMANKEYNRYDCADADEWDGNRTRAWFHTSTLHRDVRPTGNQDARPRGNLTRQWKVYCQRSSQDSSVETGNDSSAGKSAVLLRRGDAVEERSSTESTSSTPKKTPFRSIFLQLRDNNGASFTREVVIVVPKAKVDKQTQVCDSEITQETGWDVMESVYLLIRRISVKVPLITTFSPSSISDGSADARLCSTASEQQRQGTRYSAKSHSSTSQLSHFIPHSSTSQSSRETSDRTIPPSDVSKNLLHLPRDNRSDEDANTGISDISSNGRASSYSKQRPQISSRASGDKLILQDETAEENRRDTNKTGSSGLLMGLDAPPKSTLGKHDTVNEWFRRNESILKVQQRQPTVETEDSGFDDNPTHFNRHARHSLPTLQIVNGHMPLHRRPYRGRIPLDPKLVKSGSGQSVSLGDWELGNEADDELLFNPSDHDLQVRAHRRRHRLQYREDSISFSDSEINQNSSRKRCFGSHRQNANQMRKCDEPTVATNGDVQDNMKTDTNDREVIPKAENSIEKEIKTMERMDSFHDGRHRHIDDEIGQEVTSTTAKTIREDDKTMGRLNLIAGENEETFDGTKEINTHADDKHTTDTKGSSNERRVPRRDLIARGSTTASSLDSTYCGFGVSKPKRSALLSSVGDFQNLCTTAEVPDEGMSISSKTSNDVDDSYPRDIREDVDDSSCESVNTNHEQATTGYLNDKFNVCDTPKIESIDSINDDIRNTHGIDRNDVMNNLNMFSNDGIENSFSESELDELYKSSLLDLKAAIDRDFDSFSTDDHSPLEIQRSVWSPFGDIDEQCESTKVFDECEEIGIQPKPFDCPKPNGVSKSHDSDENVFHDGAKSRDVSVPHHISTNGENTDATSEDVSGSYDFATSNWFGHASLFKDHTRCEDDFDSKDVAKWLEHSSLFDCHTRCESDSESNLVGRTSLFDAYDDIDDVNMVNAVHVDGAGLHHGLVGDTNSFQVWTDTTLPGSLSVGVIGAQSHMVTETSILYTGDNLYEVSYGVTSPGFYRIFVKWDEINVPDSPFVCEVTM